MTCSHVRAAEIFAETILAQPNYNISGIVNDVTRTGKGSCTFSKFCPCQSLESYLDGRCSQCAVNRQQIIGFWSFKRHGRGNFYGDLNGTPPFCIEA